MAVKPPRLHGLHVTIVLFTLVWPSLGLKQDPRSQFFGHVVVQPKIYLDSRQKRDLNSFKIQNDDKLTVSFIAYDKEFIVDLSRNMLLLPRHYFEKHHENGTRVIHSPLKENPSHCHYQGQIRGVSQSLVAVSTCKGLSGIMSDGQEMYYIHPHHDSNNNSHFLFRASDLKPHNLTCGVTESPGFSKTHILEILKRNRRSTVLRHPYKSNETSRYVELIIVNDNKEFKEFKQDKHAVFERSKEIANIVNGLYAPLNIFIALVGVIVWSDHDEIKLSADGDATLTNFLHYRKERLAQEHPNDNAQLITAMTFDGGVVGKALKGPICTYEYSGGVNMDHSHVVGLVATTVAHELGHNFGLEHDSDECQCPDEKCIMAPSSSSTSPRHWSSCSLEYLHLAYSQGMDYCLKNHPSEIIGPVCGNGFQEEGEECDCGLKEFCDNPCCNATTCTLFPNATCAMGGCCDIETCKVKKVATACRDAASECDLPEYCDGESEVCPADVFLQNGKECGNGKAYCYDGQCRSHMDQCKLLWGSTGKMSDVRCFEQNFRGNVNGNCGYNRINQTYKACRKEDIMCGMLHCTHLNERLEFGMESAAILARSYINVKGKTFTCRAAIVDLGLFNTDPGLTPNGAKCGDGKACVNQKCVSVASIKKGDCSDGCNGNGVCNSKGNCHCDRGYNPPYCVSHGPGGSIDSGPASDPSNYFILVAMYIIFFGLVPLMFCSVCLIYYYRNDIKTWWSKKAHKANIKSKSKTTTQRKAQPPPKFNLDRKSLRTSDISAPIQIPPPAVPSGSHCSTSTLPYRTSQTVDHSNLCQAVTPPSFLQTSENSNNEKNKFIPIRPAPPRPDCVPQRTPSWTSGSNNVCPTITRTSSLRSPCDNRGVNRPISSAFRPNCPPPRPPPPKPESSVKQENSLCTYEDIGKPSGEHERSATPSSTYYDDCQTLDFSDTALAFVHMPASNNNLNNDPHERSYKSSNADLKQHECLVNKPENKILNIQNQRPVSSKGMIPHAPRTGENSVVAALAQKFEKQESKDFIPNTSMRPPFKSRPLPPRPGDSHV